MHLSTESSGILVINAYTQSSITINNVIYNRNVLIFKNKVIESNLNSNFKDLTIETLDSHLDCELILVGNNNNKYNQNVELQAKLAQRNIGLEVMSLGAAARTFNILINESRKLTALFFISS
jgi:uncharacterized protein